ncbi:hypothetical protein, partial [Enterobacter cloacae complex sp. 4DZ3-17B2]|uniref:hypothetical protein n=1 Tax=Enterobacter cloacae complex sp. 4DZ3-17B2 TaxID=2511990 RepID=UPI001CA48247
LTYGGEVDRREYNLKHIAIQQSKNLQLIAGRMYQLGNDRVLRLCINPEEYNIYLREAHVQECAFHCSRRNTYRNLLQLGVYWPGMK